MTSTSVAAPVASPQRPLLHRVPLRASSLLARLAQHLLFRAILLALSLMGAAFLASRIAVLPDHPLADMTHITGWTRIIQEKGVEGAYQGTYPDSYVIYPPGMTYAYKAAIWLSETVQPLEGVTERDWLRVSIKLVSVAGHLALAAALFVIVAAAGGFWRGWLASSLYAWNPAPLMDAAYWGQGDTLNVSLMAMGIGVLFVGPGWWPLRERNGRGGHWRWKAQVLGALTGTTAGALIATAGLVKPQTWIFLPLILWVAFRRVGVTGLITFTGAASLTALAIIQPWLQSGRMDEMLSVFTNVTQVMPSVSANGHNLWWLKLPGVALAVFDTTPVGGFGSWEAPHLLNHATIGRLGFGLFALLPLLRLTGPLSLRLVLTCTAYTSMAYFMTVTQVHENHMFAAVPFLAAAAVLDAWFIAPFLIASVCAFLNMALHDFLIGEQVAATLATWLPWKEPLTIQTANAILNVAGFGLFTLILLRRPPGPRQTARGLLWRARFVLLSGLVLAGGVLGALLAIVRMPELAERLWARAAERALLAGPVEAHLGHKTPPQILLERAALDFANNLYLLAGIAAIVGAVAAIAGGWWLLCAYHARRTMAGTRTRYDSSEI